MSHADTHRRLHELFDARNWAAFGEHIRADVTYADIGQGATMTSRDAFIEYLKGWTTAMSDATPGEPKRYLEGDGFSVSLFTGQGDNDGPFGELPATGRRMSLPFCELLWYDDSGNVRAGELYYDVMSLMAQLGHIEAPAAVSV